MPETGQPAPPFSLDRAPGTKVSLEDFRGESPVLLLFFPLAFSPVCTNELTEVRDRYERYTSLGAQVLAISVDNPFALQAWAEQLELPFPLLSDFNREVAAAYDALYEDYFGMKGVAKRSAFVIDRSGTLRYRWISDDDGQLPPFPEIRAVLEELT